MSSRRLSIDLPLALSTLLLVSVGLVLIYSTSAILAMGKMGSAYHFIVRQMVAIVIGCAFMWVAFNAGPDKIRRWAGPLMFIALIMLVLVLVPGLGKKAGGARRWLDLGIMTFQPSEFFKVVLVLFAADRLTGHRDVESFRRQGIIPVVLAAGAGAVLLMGEPDFGSFVMTVIVVSSMLFVAGVSIWSFIGPAVALGSMAVMFVIRSPYRMRRVEVFLDPWKDPQGAGFQMVHSMMAFGSGGLTGAGLGEGRQKLFYLPEPHTDFIFATAGEELGLMGCVLLVAAFGVLLWRGFVIALTCRDEFQRFAAAGLAGLLGMQVIINLFVVLGLAPTKGTTLPFLSYGGTAMIMNLCVVGILLSISRET